MPRQQDDPIFARAPKPRGRGLTIFLLILLLFIACALLFNMVNNRRVDLIRQPVTISSLPPSLEGFKILHVSDLHGARFGAGQEGIKALIDDLHYSVVCITGDSVGADGDFTGLIELIDLIPDDVPVFLLAGDEDPIPVPSTARATNNLKAEFIMAAEKHGAVYLDVPQQLTVGKTTLWVCPESFYSLDPDGTEKALLAYQKELLSKTQTSDTQAALRAVDYRLDVIKRTREIRQVMLSTDPSIVLSHVPFTEETVRTLQEWTANGDFDYWHSISLILAGHYNNGQFRLPGFGALWVPPAFGLSESGWLPDDTKLSGLSIMQGISQYISPGLGNAKIYSWLPVRFCNTPAITLLTLTAKLTK